MSAKLKNSALAVLTVALIVIFTPFFGGLFDQYFGPVSTGFFWGPAHPEYFEGFFVSYTFFITLMITVFGGVKKYKYLGVLLGVLILLYVFLTAWFELIINLSSALIAFIFAQIILLISRQFKK